MFPDLPDHISLFCSNTRIKWKQNMLLLKVGSRDGKTQWNATIPKLWSKTWTTSSAEMHRLFFLSVIDVPTQLPTQGQWWSNLAMQRLHTAQCLDRMGFRICDERECWMIPSFLLRWMKIKHNPWRKFTKHVLQNMLRSRLPVSASSTIVWCGETKTDTCCRKMNKQA